MQFFTSEEYQTKYSESIETVKIEEACEMIFAQVSQLSRNAEWDSNTVPTAIKNASMEQARFLIEQDIPHIDSKKLVAGSMKADLQSEYSTLALTMLSNAGYLYRGNPINYNMALNIEFGGD
jgi:hypothetical protein